MARFTTWLFGIGFALTLFALAPALAQEHEPQSSVTEQQATEAAPAMTTAGAEPVMTMPWPTAPVAAERDARPTTFTGRMLRWLGAWHPAAVHFPIALLLTVALLEAIALVRRKPIYTAGNKLLLAIATLSAFVAAPLGWINAGWPSADENAALTVHRWMGAALPFVMLIVWRLKPHAEAAAAGRNAPLYAIALSVAAAAILIQAYVGAEVTHGAGHMAF